MLRIAFWSLLALNLAMFAYAQGLVGTAMDNEHDPTRLKRQFNTAKMTLLTREQAEAAAQAAPAPGTPEAAAAATQARAQAAAAAPAATTPAALPTATTTAAATAAAAPAFACTQVGPLDSGDARRFEARLAALGLNDRQSRETVQAQEVSSWIVNIPPQGSKEAADRKAAELRGLGVADFYIVNGDSPLRYAISLGVFKTESGAEALLAQLNKQGVHSARITPRGAEKPHYVYRVRALDEATHKRIAGYAERYDGAAVKACG